VRWNSGRIAGYAFGMRVVVSIPDEVFKNAERLARRMKLSRSELYCLALSEYLSHHSWDKTTVAMTAALGDSPKPWI
jgi:metal-responsive CopG/Arc/MetJ family transcriptional regulator